MMRLIGRALNNLIGNALHHTPAGGSVHVQAWVEGAAVRLQVSDNGDGIEPEDLPHVFDRFYRGDKARTRTTGGAGLGLAITQAIVVAHQGAISVTSQPGEGAAFLVTIPTAPRRPPLHPLQRARVGARATA
ncbi:MAG: sensor histidine kinase [Anaerolineales bacterium]|nr:sensor histidine kinase [Anaerolineales bacterium]